MAEPVRVRRLTDQEGQKLQQIVRRGSTSSVRYRRAMMLLASADGNRVPVIAQLVQADEDTVRDVIHRFNEIGLACLDPQWAGGRPRLLGPDDEDFVIQTATIRPARPGRPFTRWSLRKLAAYLRKVHGRVIRIGRETLRRLLLRRGITFQRTKTWKQSPDPERDTKLDRIEHASRTVFSRSTSSACSASGQPAATAGPSRPSPTGCRRPTTAPTASGTSTAGTRSVTTPCGASTGARRAPPKPVRTQGRADPPLGDQAPGRTVLHPDLRVLGEPDRAHFGPLRQFTIANSNHPNHTVQTRALHAYLRRRNTNARHPDVLTAQRRERARIRSEKRIRWSGRPLAPAA